MSKVTLFGRTIDEINAYNDEFRKKGAEMSTKEIELSLVAITAREERDSLRKENADLKAKLDSYHAERQELRGIFLPSDCDWEHHPSLVQCAKDLKAKLDRLTTDYRNLAETYRHDTGELREKLEATLQVQFDVAAFEKVKRERDAAEACCKEMRLLISNEGCIVPGCGGKGWYEVAGVDQHGNLEPQQEQCQWCDERSRCLSSSCGQGFVRASENTFGYGVVSMARNCLPSIELVRQGKWTLDDVTKWLNAVISNDADYLQTLRGGT